MRFGFFFLLLIGCKGGVTLTSGTEEATSTPTLEPHKPSSGLQEVREAGYHGVIIPESHQDHMGMVEAAGGKLSGYWTPDIASIRLFESGLVAYLEAEAKTRSPKLHQKSKSYKRQYIGFLVGERKLIYGNFLCTAMARWTERAVGVDDGGDCFFQVVFDISKRAYSDLYINGPG